MYIMNTIDTIAGIWILSLLVNMTGVLYRPLFYVGLAMNIIALVWAFYVLYKNYKQLMKNKDEEEDEYYELFKHDRED